MELYKTQYRLRKMQYADWVSFRMVVDVTHEGKEVEYNYVKYYKIPIGVFNAQDQLNDFLECCNYWYTDGEVEVIEQLMEEG